MNDFADDLAASLEPEKHQVLIFWAHDEDVPTDADTIWLRWPEELEGEFIFDEEQEKDF